MARPGTPGASPGGRSDPGVVFTPAPLARRVERRLASLAPQGALLLDPACGAGELLIPAATSGHWGGLRGIELDPGLAGRARERLDGAVISQADALDPATDWPAGAWIAANPPWVSFSGRQAARGRLRSASADSRRRAGGWPSLHGAFLERIAQHVRTHGTGAVVLLPASLIDLVSYAPLRARVEQWVRPAGVRELGEDAFHGVVEPAVELTLVPGAPGAPGGDQGDAPGLRPGGIWSRSPAAEQLQLAFARHPRLPARSFADPGVHTGNSAALVVRPPDEVEHAALAQGRDLDPYRLGPASARLRTDLAPGGERRFRISAADHYASFPILLRQTANRPLAGLHEPRGYFRNSLLACRDVPGLDPAFVVAVLNSAPATAWHRACFRDARQRTFPQVKVGHLATQPFPIAHRDQDPRLHDDLARRVRALAAAPAGPGDDGQERREIAAIERAVTEAFGLEPKVLALVRELAGEPA